jgi:hypothetical protein
MPMRLVRTSVYCTTPELIHYAEYGLLAYDSTGLRLPQINYFITFDIQNILRGY